MIERLTATVGGLSALVVLLVLPLLLSGTALAAQYHTPVGDVRACLPMSGGQVAVGSAGGLLLVDRGSRQVARRWTANNGLPGTRVHALEPTADGGAWVATELGLARLDKDRKTLTPVGPRARVWSVLRHGGALWLGTRSKGLLRLDPSSGKVRAVPFAAAKTGLGPGARAGITALTVHAGQVVAGTAGGGLYTVQGRANRGRLVSVHARLKTRWVRSLSSFGGRLWVGTMAGLVSAGQGDVRQEATAHVRSLAVVNGTLWAGGHDGRLVAVAGVKAGASRSVGQGAVQAMRATAVGVCVGAQRGLEVGVRWGSLHRIALGGPPTGDISALAHDGERLWVGFFDQGLRTLEADGQWRVVAGVDRNVNVLKVQPRKGGAPVVWVGTGRGLHRIAGGEVRVFGRADGLPHDGILSLALGSKGDLLIGTSRGLARLDASGRIRQLGRKQGLPVGSVWALVEGPDGHPLVGTARGLYRHTKGDKWERLSIVSGHLDDDYITALVVGPTGQIWAGTYNSGVVRLDFVGDTVRTTKLGGGWVNLAGLSVLGERVVVATMNGLLSRPLTRGGKWRKVANAAPGQDVTATVRDPKTPGAVWVASRRGLARLTTL